MANSHSRWLMMAVLVGFSFLPQILSVDAPASRIDLATTLNLPWLAQQVEILEDPSQQLDLAAVLQQPDAHWQRTMDPILNPGIFHCRLVGALHPVQFRRIIPPTDSRSRLAAAGSPRH